MDKKTRFKGMTLFEIVISIAIYGTIALLLVEIMGQVNSTMKNTTVLSERLSYEQKYADNRLAVADSKGTIVADDKNVSIAYGASGSTKTISAAGKQYEIQYTGSEHVAADAYNVNYRYMVFKSNPDGPDYDVPFEIPLHFENDTCKYDVTKIEVFEIASDGQAQKLSDSINVVEYDEGSHEPILHDVLDEDGHEVYETVDVIDDYGNTTQVTRKKQEKYYTSQPRVSGDVSHGYRVIVERTPESPGLMDGSKTVRIVLYGDVSEKTGGDPTKTILDETDNVNYPAGEFPFLRFNLTYTAWVKDSLGKLKGFYYDPGLTFVVNEDFTISTT